MNDRNLNPPDPGPPAGPHGRSNPDLIDPLEAKLGKLRPRPMSLALRNRITDVVSQIPDQIPDEGKSAPRPRKPDGLDIRLTEPSTTAADSFPFHPAVRMWFGIAAGIICVISVGVAVRAVFTPAPPHGSESAMALSAEPSARPAAPTLLNYLKAASENDEALDLLLDKDARVLLTDRIHEKEKESATTQP